MCGTTRGCYHIAPVLCTCLPAQDIVKLLSANATAAAAAARLVADARQGTARGFVAGAAILGAAAGGKAAATAVPEALVKAAQLNLEVGQVARNTFIACHALWCVPGSIVPMRPSRFYRLGVPVPRAR